jgi:hypothetical protein
MYTALSQSRQSPKRFSSRWNWDSPTPLAPPPPLVRGGRAHSLAALRLKGWGSPNSNEGTYTVVLYIYKYFVCAVNQDQNYMNTGEEILKEETNFGAGEVGERE